MVLAGGQGTHCHRVTLIHSHGGASPKFSKGNIGYPPSCSQNIAPDSPDSNQYITQKIGDICWSISRVLSRGGYPTFPFEIFNMETWGPDAFQAPLAEGGLGPSGRSNDKVPCQISGVVA